MKIVAATKNIKKLKEIREILGAIRDIELLSLNEFPEFPDIPETGSTFQENALIKAREVARITGLAALSDDSGLAVDALDGRPGVFSARYGGPDASDHDRCLKLLDEMKKVEHGRTARFICSMAVVLPDGREFTAEGTVEGIITKAPAGSGGFGYDPVFFVESSGRTMAELTPDEKNSISHRASALKKAVEIIRSL
jgi:XTP/dITP diphosphohydrolase